MWGQSYFSFHHSFLDISFFVSEDLQRVAMTNQQINHMFNLSMLEFNTIIDGFKENNYTHCVQLYNEHDRFYRIIQGYDERFITAFIEHLADTNHIAKWWFDFSCDLRRCFNVLLRDLVFHEFKSN